MHDVKLARGYHRGGHCDGPKVLVNFDLGAVNLDDYYPSLDDLEFSTCQLPLIVVMVCDDLDKRCLNELRERIGSNIGGRYRCYVSA